LAYEPQGEETVPEYPHYRGKREIGKGRKRYQLSAFSRQLESYKFSLYEAVPKMTIWNYLYGFPIHFLRIAPESTFDCGLRSGRE
jgi:hypothetical protein